MRRRLFLSLPFVAAAARAVAAVSKSVRRLWSRQCTVGVTGDYATLREALASQDGNGGTIYLMPGHTETITEALDITGMSLIGPAKGRPLFWWRS